MKTRALLVGIITFFALTNISFGQATKSYPFAVGGDPDNTNKAEIHFYNYNGTANEISGIASTLVGDPVARYTPQLKIGNSGSGSQRFTQNLAGVSFNPKDKNIYYFWINTSTTGIGSLPRTYVWRWPVGSKPTDNTNRLDTLCSIPGFILGLAFDNEGNTFALEFSTEASGVPHTGYLRSIDLSTGALGAQSPLVLTGGAVIYEQGSGDVVMTPSGQMLFAVNNKLFTPDYKSYDGSGNPITCTYVDTIKISTSLDYVGMTYAEGKTIAAFWGGSYPFYEVNPLTADASKITTVGQIYRGADLASVISGIGAAKKLISVTPTGTANQYDVVYDVYIRNYGNMDVTDVQLSDDLRNINGAANVTLTSVAFTDNPAGLVLNPGYNGKTDLNLLDGNGTLPNYPVADNHATIRITCRLSNILPGVVYNNNATLTSVDFNGNLLTDVSTNGSNPDPNGNDKPDDEGEDRPTPLLITVAASSDPCVTLGQIMYKQSFTHGGKKFVLDIAGQGGSILPTTQYAGHDAPLPVETFMLAQNAQIAEPSKWIDLQDHTGTYPDGRMMLVNADSKPNIIYSDEVTPVCANQQYSFFFYGAFIGNSDYKTICDGFGGFKYPRVTIRIRDKATGLIITQLTTGDITSSSWQQYGLKFAMPVGFGTVILELINDGDGGCGNDLAIDDIQFGLCSPAPKVKIGTATDGCYGAPATFSATLSDPTAINGSLEYQWQVADDPAGPWTDISGATADTYTISAVGTGDVGKYYRVIVAATGNMGSPSCEYTSQGYLLIAKDPSVAPVAALTSHANVCPGKEITLTVQGGTLGTGASWKWYSGSCGGTLLGTGATIKVNPMVTTTYYVRAEGECNLTDCQQVTVTVNCDIDKDKDGIPDWVESNIAAAFGDHDADGILNAYDEDYPGFVDHNGDFINDWFQADGDVDGDGIPNYLDTDFPGRVDINGDGVDDRFDADLDGIINMLDLDSDNDGIPDVVEAGGTDQDGDGKLDNFIDADGDGLHDLVDANTGGAYNSGVGLGLKDTDKDGVPNQFDLDSDNDGIPDVREVGGVDNNNDGRIDNFIDLNADGISDNIVGSNALLRTGPDTNNDGRADSYPYHNMDKDNVPNPYDLDSDGDGIVDVVEAGLSDINFDGKIDGPIGPNGWSTVVAAMPTLTLRNSDGDPNADYLDIDSDNDGIPDLIEGPATTQFKFPLGIDGDNDGIDDAFDSKPGVWGGYGNFQIDSDGDGTPDYLDQDADGDGVPDIKEGHDYDFNGIFDENTTLTGVDSDGDGLDDVFDLDNTSAKGTSSNLGNGGSTAGDPNPGTRAVVQKTLPSAPDRDWRNIDLALDVTYFRFSGNYSGNSAVLSWEVQATEDITGFEVMRSTDNLHFESITQMNPRLAGNQQGHFGYQDDLSTVNTQNVFYRLKLTGITGRTTLSDVIRINTEDHARQVTIKPNPANSFAQLNFSAVSSGKARVRIINNNGKIVYTKDHQIAKGQNKIEFNNLGGYANGLYNVQIVMNGELINVKLLIAR